MPTCVGDNVLIIVLTAPIILADDADPYLIRLPRTINGIDVKSFMHFHEYTLEVICFVIVGSNLVYSKLFGTSNYVPRKHEKHPCDQSDNNASKQMGYGHLNNFVWKGLIERKIFLLTKGQ